MLNEYFGGEKIEALVFILSIGLLTLVFSIWLFTEGGRFATGVACPLLLLIVIAVTVGGVVGFRTPSQVKSLEQGLVSAKEQTLKAEIIRMDKVNKAWPVYLAVWIAFGVIGLLLRVFVNDDFFQGMGISLVFFSGVTLLIDGFAERRAAKYAGYLQKEYQSFIEVKE